MQRMIQLPHRLLQLVIATASILGSATSGSATLSASPPPGSVIVVAASPAQSVVFTPQQSTNRFVGAFITFAQQDLIAMPDRDALLAVGSSSIRMWQSLPEALAPRPVVNRGFGGSSMRDVVEFLPFFLRYDVRDIVVYQGDNDLASDERIIDRDFIAYCQTFASAVLATRPETRIHFIAIKPSPARHNALPRFTAANQALATWCASDPRLFFIDGFTPLLDPDGAMQPNLYLADQLHLNVAGYLIWNAVIAAHFAALP
jgi:lysophospholipase L1-like esterase